MKTRCAVVAAVLFLAVYVAADYTVTYSCTEMCEPPVCTGTKYKAASCLRICSDPVWSSYTAWAVSSPCSCGTIDVIHVRKRNCTQTRSGMCKKTCTGVGIIQKHVPCVHSPKCPKPVAGIWSVYGKWEKKADCDASCGGGIIIFIRERKCTTPGKKCVGNTTNTVQFPCSNQMCPVNGGWSDFGDWKLSRDCSVTCGTGTILYIRTKKCTKPRPTSNGKPCSGDGTEVDLKSCQKQSCPGQSSGPVVEEKLVCFTCNSGIGRKNRKCPANGIRKPKSAPSSVCYGVCYTRTNIGNKDTIYRGCSRSPGVPSKGCVKDENGDKWCYCKTKHCNGRRFATRGQSSGPVVQKKLVCFTCNSGIGWTNRKCPANGIRKPKSAPTSVCYGVCYTRNSIWNKDTIYRGCSRSPGVPSKGCVEDENGDKWCYCKTKHCNRSPFATRG